MARIHRKPSAAGLDFVERSCRQRAPVSLKRKSLSSRAPCRLVRLANVAGARSARLLRVSLIFPHPLRPLAAAERRRQGSLSVVSRFAGGPMGRPRFVVAVALALELLSLGASRAEADVITISYSWIASSFACVTGCGGDPGAPVDPVTGAFVLTFNNSRNLVEQTAGLTVSGLNIPLGSYPPTGTAPRRTPSCSAACRAARRP